MAPRRVAALSEADLALLKALQVEFPLVPEPYEALARSLDLSEKELLRRTGALRSKGLIRQIGGTFDTRRLGYDSVLVAMQIDPARADEAAQVVNRHPGVSHNYLREDPYNLWFTLAVPADSRLGLDRTVSVLEDSAGSRATLVLPALRVFKLDLTLALGEAGSTKAARLREAEPGDLPAVAEPLAEENRRLVRVLQSDLPITTAPFQPLAARAGIPVGALLREARRLLAQGFMRRYGAIVRHRRAGLRANAMGVWAVGPERVEEVGRALASFRFVSHCYQRPSHPRWPYTIFTMVHAGSAAECQEMFRTLAGEAGVSEYRALYTVREYKKEKVRYFSPAFSRWEREHGAR